MELFSIETLMEEMKTTFREKYVFDLRGKSLTVSTLGKLWRPAVWYLDENDEFLSHNLLENCGPFQTGAEWEIWWLRLQSGIFSIWSWIRCQNTFAEFETVSVWFEDQQLGFWKDFTSNNAKFFDWDPARRNPASSYEVLSIRLSKKIYIVYFSGNLRVSRLWCRVENWQFFSATNHQVVENSNWDLQRKELGLYLWGEVCLVVGKILEW